MIKFPMRLFFPFKNKTILSLLAYIVLCGLIMKGVSYLTYTNGLTDLKEKGNVRLELYTNYLQGVLEKYESLPELLAVDNALVRALLNPNESKRIETLNKYLETINTVSDTLDTYLLNKDGLTIAASNWNEERPFVGRNFSYRPYFKQAMKGKLGRYFALGTTSSRRGYYFAYPVRKGDVILGAVVIKINIDRVEEKWADRDDNFLVSDPDGIIFITTNPKWRYKTLQPLEPDVLTRIRESRRYPNSNFIPLGRQISDTATKTNIVEIDNDLTLDKKKVLKQSQYMPQAGWDVHILSDIRILKTNVLVANILVVSILIGCFIFILLLLQRNERQTELKRIEAESKKALQEANELLESRVSDRTQKLTTTNELLRKEILERKETEVKLKRTKRELIHAAKLAVLGQMSAGINHELNQPLAAIRSYTDNGLQFLEKGRLEEAMGNLKQIGELTERMAQIGAQLKLFSKKSSGQIVSVPLHGVIDGALEILKPSLKKAQVEFSVHLSPQNVEVLANHVLLQQVLVNLISNAMQALENQEVKIITLECLVKRRKVAICIQDNGPGIPVEIKDRIFEPFYTTKKSGQGLGLGLTISDRIIRDLGSKIELVKSGSGARFEFSLDKVG